MISVADLKAHLNLTTSVDDSYLTDLEAGAVEYVEGRTNWYLGAAAEYTEYLIGGGTAKLWLAEAPDTGETITVVERAYPGASDSTTITEGDATGYLVRSKALIRKGGAVWYEGYEYTVTYTRGYASGSEPEWARQAVRTLVGQWYEKRLPVAEVGVSAPANTIPHHLSDLLAAKRRSPRGAV